MAYGAAPNFPDGSVLTARQLNMLDACLDHLYGIGKGASIPQRIWQNTDAAGAPDPTPVYNGYVMHRHGTNEYLYYDVLVTNNDGSEEVDCDIYYKDIDPTGDTPLVTLHASASRQRGLVSITDKPSEGDHPADGDLVPVKVYAVKSAGDEACTVTVYRLEEILLPEDYTTLDDAGALTDGEVTDVAADLQILSDNYVSLDAISMSDNPGFRCVQSDDIDLGMGTKTLYSGTFCTHKTGRLYYRVGLAKDTSTIGDTVTVTIRLNSNAATDTCITYNGAWAGIEEPHIEEGYIDLSGYLSSWEYQQRIRVDVYVSYSSNYGFGRAVLYYLGEYGTAADADWIDFDAYAHGDYVEGDGGAAADNLRSLYANAQLLADDDGTGYRANHDMAGDGNYPVGYAIAACRNTVQHGGIGSLPSYPKGRFGIVRLDDESNGQRMAFCRVKDFLYYRTKGGQIAYTGEDGEKATHPLDDYDDDNDYQVLDLNEIQGLSPGMWYYVEAVIDTVSEGDTGEILDWAAERDD